jgi:hypothetical protein
VPIGTHTLEFPVRTSPVAPQSAVSAAIQKALEEGRVANFIDTNETKDIVKVAIASGVTEQDRNEIARMSRSFFDDDLMGTSPVLTRPTLSYSAGAELDSFVRMEREVREAFENQDPIQNLMTSAEARKIVESAKNGGFILHSERALARHLFSKASFLPDDLFGQDPSTFPPLRNPQVSYQASSVVAEIAFERP